MYIALSPNERGLQLPQVVDAVPPLMVGRPQLWDAPVAFLLSNLEEAGARVAERGPEAEKTIYIRRDPGRHLYCLTKVWSSSTKATGDIRKPS